MSNASPVFLGQFPAIKAGDIADRYIQLSQGADDGDLAADEAISSVTFSVKNSAGTVQTGAIGAHSETDTRTDFRINAPATAGMYELTAVFTINDGQKITRTATLRIV